MHPLATVLWYLGCIETFTFDKNDDLQVPFDKPAI